MTDESSNASSRRKNRNARNIYNVCPIDFERPTDAAEYFMQQSMELRQANEKLRGIGLSKEATLSLIGSKGPSLAHSLSHDVETKSLHYLLTTAVDPISKLTQAEKWNLLYLIAFMYWREIFWFAHLDLDVYNSYRQLVNELPKTLIDWYKQVLVPCLTPDIWIGGGLQQTGYNNMGPVPAACALILNLSMDISSRLRVAQVAFANCRGKLGPIQSLDKHVVDCIKEEADQLVPLLSNDDEEVTGGTDECFDVFVLANSTAAWLCPFLRN
jgi:hypothetical protein